MTKYFVVDFAFYRAFKGMILRDNICIEILQNKGI